jgi:hypothetical protein
MFPKSSYPYPQTVKSPPQQGIVTYLKPCEVKRNKKEEECSFASSRKQRTIPAYCAQGAASNTHCAVCVRRDMITLHSSLAGNGILKDEMWLVRKFSPNIPPTYGAVRNALSFVFFNSLYYY